MDEVEIEMSSHHCKNVEEYVTFHFEFVITFCERARDLGPIVHSAEYFQQWDFPGTPAAQGSSLGELETFPQFPRPNLAKRLGVYF